MEVPVEDARRLEAMVLVLTSYIEGLGDAGWHGGPNLVRTGYGVAIGLRFGVDMLRQLMPILLDERLHPYIEQLLGRPFDEIMENRAAVSGWLADLVPEG